MNVKVCFAGLLFSVVSFLMGCMGIGSRGSQPEARQTLADVSGHVPAFRNISIDTVGMLVVYTPHFRRMDLVCGTMPQPTDTSVILTCAAAFTGTLHKGFDHQYIAGNHVSSGVFHQGYQCKANTGAFVYYGNQWKFVCRDDAAEVCRAADEGGMAFSQILFIKDGLYIPANIKSKHLYRALCERRGKLCVIESRHEAAFMEFVRQLGRYGVRNAIYLDMGAGWNHSWYRDNDGLPHEIHPKMHDDATNWITFYR